MHGNDKTAKALIQKYAMNRHPENGIFIEKHYPHEGSDRAASGAIYYYVAPEEHTGFHRIDCDEYWCYACGAPLEVWVIRPDGTLSVHRLGIEDDCEPMLYLNKGMIFASRHAEKTDDGTFITCITVPRFTYAGFELFTKEEIISLSPETEEFFKTYP